MYKLKGAGGWGEPQRRLLKCAPRCYLWPLSPTCYFPWWSLCYLTGKPECHGTFGVRQICCCKNVWRGNRRWVWEGKERQQMKRKVGTGDQKAEENWAQQEECFQVGRAECAKGPLTVTHCFNNCYLLWEALCVWKSSTDRFKINKQVNIQYSAGSRGDPTIM